MSASPDSGSHELDAPRPAHPGVHFPPPFLFAGGFVLGWLMHRAYPLPVAPGGRSAATVIPGWALLAAGLAVMLWALAVFARARTSPLPMRPARTVVTAGPFRFSRNPMYVGMTAAYVGLSLLTNMLWPVVVLPTVLAALVALVIRREERYLRAAFGATYEEYARRVRRWL